MNYCPHCMREAEGAFCPHCGKSTKVETNPSHLPVGTVLQANGGWHTYLVGAALGQGGFGITYVARNQESGQKIALKEYCPTVYAERSGGNMIVAKPNMAAKFEKGCNDFLKEARRLAEMQALPSVVRALDFFQANGTGYLAMEFLEGVPLSKKVKDEGKIPADQLLPRMKALMRDIDAMHKKEIIHRDIAPDNIMWMPDGTLKLIDFGCARSTDGENTVMYKPGFAPVEQYTRRDQGAWTDVYGMAATIYFCLTATVPEDALSRLDNPDLPMPSQFGAKLDPTQESSIMKGLAFQPRNRYQTMADFSLDLFKAPPPPLPPVPPVPPVPPTPVISNDLMDKFADLLNGLKNIDSNTVKIIAGIAVGGAILLLLLLG